MSRYEHAPLSAGVRRADPAHVTVLANACLLAAVICLVTVLHPFSATAPRTLVTLLAAVALVIGLALRWAAGRTPVGAMHAVLALATTLVSLSVARATTPAGIVVTSVSFVWIAVYVATFLERRAMIAHLGLIAVGLASGLWAAEAGSLLQTWFFLTMTVGSVSWILNDKVTQLRRHATTDPLTGALTRLAFRATAESEMARASRTGEDLTLVLLDLDDFKRVNDELGHAAGDDVLVALTRTWRSRLRSGDALGRYGGDEFTLLLPSTDAPQAHQLLARMRTLDGPCDWSAGVVPWRGQAFDEWMRGVDAALYVDKAR